jgi:hypothetical protein
VKARNTASHAHHRKQRVRSVKCEGACQNETSRTLRTTQDIRDTRDRQDSGTLVSTGLNRESQLRFGRRQNPLRGPPSIQQIS